MTAYERYRKKTIVRVQLAFNRNTDADILKWLGEVPNMTGAIKAAIRADIVRQKAGTEDSPLNN